MLIRILLVILIVGSVTSSSFASKIVPNQVLVHDNPVVVKRDTYKTEDILLLFKSCYETIYFLGNTKYKIYRKKLTNEAVSRQCFCICDKIRAKYEPKEFLDKPPLDIHNIIKPLTSECIKERGPIWNEQD